MIAFLRWLRDIALGTLNGIVKFAFFVVLVIVAVVAVALVQGDGLPKKMVLNLDLRVLPAGLFAQYEPVFRSPHAAARRHDFGARPRRPGLPRQRRVSRRSAGGLPVAQAEEIGRH